MKIDTDKLQLDPVRAQFVGMAAYTPPPSVPKQVIKKDTPANRGAISPVPGARETGQNFDMKG